MFAYVACLSFQLGLFPPRLETLQSNQWFLSQTGLVRNSSENLGSDPVSEAISDSEPLTRSTHNAQQADCQTHNNSSPPEAALNFDHWYIAHALALKGVYFRNFLRQQEERLAEQSLVLERRVSSQQIRLGTTPGSEAIAAPDVPAHARRDNLSTEQGANPVVTLSGFPQETQNGLVLSPSLPEAEDPGLPYMGDFSITSQIENYELQLGFNQPDAEHPTTGNLSELRIEHSTAAADRLIGSHEPFWESKDDYWGYTHFQRWGFTLPESGAVPNLEQRRTTDLLPLREQIPEDASTLIVSGGWQRSLSTRKRDDPVGEFEDFQGGFKLRHGISQQLTVGWGSLYVDEEMRGVGEVFLQVSDLPLQASLEVLTPTEEDPWDVIHSLELNLDSELHLSWEGNRDRMQLLARYQPLPGLSVQGRLENYSDDASDRMQIFARYELFDGFNFQGTIDDRGNETAMAHVQLQLSELTLATTGKLESPVEGEDRQTLETRLSWHSQAFSTAVSSHLNNQGSWRWVWENRLGDLEILAQHSSDRRTDSTNNTWQITYTDTDPAQGGGQVSNQFNLRHQQSSQLSQAEHLSVLSWSHHLEITADSAWKWELGYGIGSQGEGAIASLTSPRFLGGLQLRGTFSGISLTSDATTFEIELTTD